MADSTTMTRKLLCGDCLDILDEGYIDTASINTIYLDPPFNSQQEYNLPFINIGKEPGAVSAFKDNWSWDDATRELYERLKNENLSLYHYIGTVKEMRGGEDGLSAYLVNMAVRLNAMRRVLRSDGSLFLHCDPTASHYLKLILDTIFGHKNFCNEIIWCYSGGGIPKSRLPRKHDVILWYSKGSDPKYRPIYRSYTPGTMQRGRTQVKGEYYERGLNPQGTPINDWWPDVPKITSPTDPEKLGYPTQKSLALMERIIDLTTDEGDLVLDPFCGCGTTLHASEKKRRSWIGIDISRFSVGVVKNRLLESFPGQDLHKHIHQSGIPVDYGTAKQLAEADPWEFEKWACGQLGAKGLYKKPGEKGKDYGIDGVVEFYLDKNNKTYGIVQVKSGKVTPSDVKALYSDVTTEPRVTAGIFVCFDSEKGTVQKHRPKVEFQDKIAGNSWDTVQVLTVEDILAGEKPKLPNQVIQQGFKTEVEQPNFLDD